MPPAVERDRRRLVLPALFAMACGAVLPAQRNEPREFTAPDGSRFLLVPTGGPPLVHWALATSCGPLVDPADASGLAAACAQASLRGTFASSRDARREADLLNRLDAAEAELEASQRASAGPRAALIEQVAQLRLEASQLADPNAFLRQLLAAPADFTGLVARGGTAILTLTTLPEALDNVARLLVERREQPALRSVRSDFDAALAKAIAAWDAFELAPLYAEALALAFADSPLAHSGDRPLGTGFSRPAALQLWARTQHPVAGRHVLVGNFDLDAAERTLRSVFATTALPLPPPVEAGGRTLAGIRRSTVPGARHPACIIAWPLAGDEPPWAIECVSILFAGDQDAWLGRELVRQGRPRVQVRSIAPWPVPGRASKLLVEVVDPAGSDYGLADQVLALARGAAVAVGTEADLARAWSQLAALWEHETRSGPATAALFAERWLLQPGRPQPLQGPAPLPLAELQALLRRLLLGTPVVVEWRQL